jgi:hypothetical protein
MSTTEQSTTLRVVDPDSYVDKQATDWHPVHDALRRQEILGLLTEDLIREHAGNPLGLRPHFHSEGLQRVLRYFRTQAIRARHLPYKPDEAPGYRIVEIERDQVLRILPDEYPTFEAALNGIFLLRIADLRATTSPIGASGDADE